MRISRLSIGIVSTIATTAALAIGYGIETSERSAESEPLTVLESVGAPSVPVGQTAQDQTGQSATVVQNKAYYADQIKKALDDSGLPQVGVIFGNRDRELARILATPDKPLLPKLGEPAPPLDFSTRYPIASASKLLLGIMAMRMVEAGRVSLDAPLSTYFDYWATPASGDIRAPETLAFLMSQTGGFNHGILINGCADNSNYTLQACAQQIYQSGLQRDIGGPPHKPGEVFSYGAQDLQLAAAVLEKAGQAAEPDKDFNALFDEFVRVPAGVTETAYLDAGNPILPSPDPSGDPENAYAAKEGYSTGNDYAIIMRKLLHGDLISNLYEFFKPRTLGAKKDYPLAVSFIPPSVDKDGDWQYALGSWSVCHKVSKIILAREPYSAECEAKMVNSSPGLFGWTPWIDRSTGYWAVIVTKTMSGDGKAVPLQKALEELIKSYLAAPD